MKFSDLLSTSIKNLLRRRLRTVLTVLGVVIGTASVVTMLSLGFGMEKMTEDMYASFGSMNVVTVNAPYSSGDKPKYLTDDLVEQLSRMPHVDYVSPKLTVSTIIKQGAYMTSIPVTGLSQDLLAGMDLKSGSLPKSGELGYVMGNMVLISFENEKGGRPYWETKITPPVDYSKTLYIIYDTEKYYDAKNSKEPGKTGPKKYALKVSGEIAGAVDEFNEYSYGVYTDIDALKAFLKRIYGKNPIPGQPTNKKGKPYSYFCYDELAVCCDNMNNVMDVQKAINDMGYNAYSNMEWLEQSKQQTNLIRAALGGIGAISLLVAAIGIANTMMMSIYERTKEIGIMKVLGCDMNEIRNMFLLESGFIGFAGGVLGVLLSLLLSYVVNHLGLGSQLTGMSGNMSLIPLWLIPTSIGFAIFISMLAGFVPSVKAMNLSPLEAIRNE